MMIAAYDYLGSGIILMTSGAPLCRGMAEAMEGFHNLDPDDDDDDDDNSHLAGATSLSDDQMDAFVRLGYGGGDEEELWMREMGPEDRPARQAKYVRRRVPAGRG